MNLNGIRVFLTGFLVFDLDPSPREGFMHYTEGWAMFVFAFAGLSAMGWLLSQAERAVSRIRVV